MHSILAHQSAPTPPLGLGTWSQPDHSTVEFEALLIGYLTLSNLVDDNRWITLVADKNVDLHRIKQSFGRQQRLRIIQAGQADLLWITWQCLAQGNSQTVITVLDEIAVNDKQQLQNAAELGRSTLHMIKNV